MRTVAPVARVLADQIILGEAESTPNPAFVADALQRASARLRWRLVVLVGTTGFAALLSRAIRLAQEDYPDLKVVTLNASGDGVLRGLDVYVTATGADQTATTAGLLAIIAHLIGLLITFIGEDIAVRLVHEALPELGRATGIGASGVEKRA